MNVLLYLINSTQLLLLFLNGRTGRQPHDDDDDDVLLIDTGIISTTIPLR